MSMLVSQWKEYLKAAEDVLNAVEFSGDWPKGSDVQKACQLVRENFESDYKSCAVQLSFIFDDPLDVEDTTRANVALLRQWYMDQSPLCMPAICAYACDRMIRGDHERLKKALMVGAVLAELQHPHTYHNNMHFRKVLLQMLRLIIVHNNIFDDTERALDETQVITLLITACVHDLGHDGQGNTVKGVYEQSRLEKRSFDLVKPYLAKAGMDDAPFLEALQVMILCTDVTPLGAMGNPCNQAKAAYRYHFLGQSQSGRLNLDPELKALERDAELSLMAMLMHEADIATSAGLSYPVTKFETIILHEEIQVGAARASNVLDFLRQICNRQMTSDAAQKLYAANMARIYALAEEQVRDGDTPFPDAQHSEFMQMLTRSSKDGDSKTIN